MDKIVNPYVLQDVSAKDIMVYLTETSKEKKSGVEFNYQDVQGYIRRGYLPHYLGGNKIEFNRVWQDIKLYNVLVETVN